MRKFSLFWLLFKDVFFKKSLQFQKKCGILYDVPKMRHNDNCDDEVSPFPHGAFQRARRPSAVSDGKHGSVSPASLNGSEILAFPFGADRVNRVAS